jgi:hypothetical protein
MSNVFRRSFLKPFVRPAVPALLVPALLVVAATLLAAPIAQAQTPAAPPTAFDKQLERIDFAISGVGLFTNTVSGIEKRDNAPLSEYGSNTAGALITLRYIKKPLLGFEFNYGYSRYTQDFVPNTIVVGGVQNKATEYSLGYVAHIHKLDFMGLQPFAGAGGGTIAFTPTPYGGQGLKEQARAAYYYQAGVEDPIFTSHIGIRASFRQLIYLAPDFGQNYLTITRRTRTSEPQVGFYARF